MDTLEPATKTAAPGVRQVDVSVIVPVTTGDAKLEAVVKGFGDEFARLGKPCEFVLVGDGVGGTT